MANNVDPDQRPRSVVSDQGTVGSLSLVGVCPLKQCYDRVGVLRIRGKHCGH